MISKLFSITKKTNNAMNSNQLFPPEEHEYGFFCDIEHEEFNTYPRQNINLKKLYPIKEETNKSTSSIKLSYDNLKHEIYNISVNTILAYICVSIGSIYLTTMLFYRYNP